VTVPQDAMENAGSLFDTYNEEGDSVSVGFAMAESELVDWVVIAELTYGEVVAPIDELRNVLLACVFGTLGAVLLFTCPVAYYAALPIVRLRAATKRTIEPHGSDYDDETVRTRGSSSSGHPDSPNVVDEENLSALARKEGFFRRMGRSQSGQSHRGGVKKRPRRPRSTFRIPDKVPDSKHLVYDELTDLTATFNEMSEELMMQYEKLEERVRERTAELELSKKAAEAANESKTLFIANISHELKTPLNGILGMAYVCMHEEDLAKIKKSLGTIYSSGDLLLNLLTDLLTFSRNEMGQQLVLDEKEFPLAEISSQIITIFEKQARESNIKLSIEFMGPSESLDTASGTPGEPGYGPVGTGKVRDMCLWGDKHRILQVIINLVSNSL
jgi:osomolarity two-component system, sensor histidine kinase SLN1